MAFIRIVLIAALVVAAIAEPLRYRRQVAALIASSGAAAADGQGTAADAHQAAVVALGIPASSSGNGWGSDSGNGWGSDSSTPGVPASIVISNSGISGVGNDASILEITNNDGAGNLAGLQSISVEQSAIATDGLDVEASGGEIALGSSDSADVTGAGSSAAAGTLEILAN